MKTPKTRKFSNAARKGQASKVIRSAAKRSRTKPEHNCTPIVATNNGSDQRRPRGKLGHVLDAVAAESGASLDELVRLTGWQAHTTRAALTRLRQRGFEVGLRETDDRKAYHLAEAPSQ
jgi:hypothetical protein